MRRLAALALLPLAGCGGGSGNEGGATENQIKQLSTPEIEIVDPQAPVRPQSLKIADLAGARMPVPDCASAAMDGCCLPRPPATPSPASTTSFAI